MSDLTLVPVLAQLYKGPIRVDSLPLPANVPTAGEVRDPLPFHR